MTFPSVPKKREDIVELLKIVLVNATKKRLMSDRSIGCLLSGGLDSSIITTILVSLLGKDKVRTYSIGMEGSTDLFYARKVADYLGTNHTEVKFTPEDGLRVIPEVVKNLESYDITTVRASVGMYLLAEYIKENTNDKVIFSGEGSDELFCGYLYFHNAPDIKSSAEESRRLVDQLYKYDVLRADRMISCHGLELRVPFLDRCVINTAFKMDPKYKVCSGIEKSILREAFSGTLPKDVLWRQKCAFSDGVSEVRKSWYEYITEFADVRISDAEFESAGGKNKYRSKEDYLYKELFVEQHPTYRLELPTWMPKWSDTNDPSARTLKVCTEKDN